MPRFASLCSRPAAAAAHGYFEPRTADAPGCGAVSGAARPELIVGKVDDPLEREADRIADRVVRLPDTAVSVTAAAPQLSRQCAVCAGAEKPRSTRAAEKAPALAHEALRSPGQPLDAAMRAYFEPRLGHDFSRVRLHRGTAAEQSARELDANAYTVGNDIVLGAGRSAAGAVPERRLLAHELAHVVQQPADPAAIGPAVLRRDNGAGEPIAEEDRPPANRGYGVITLDQLIRDVQTIEAAYPDSSPQEILTMIRSLYYGSAARSPGFDRLIPDAPDTGAVRECYDDEGNACDAPVGVCTCFTAPGGEEPPTPKLVKAIDRLKLHADENASGDNPSPYVLVGDDVVDLGHVLVGADALLHPRTEKRPFARNDLPTAPGPATWVGDLGAAMVYLQEHEQSGKKSPDVTGDPSPTVEDYYFNSAPMSDILGDVDAFGVFEFIGSSRLFSSTLSEALTIYYVGTPRASAQYESSRWKNFADFNDLTYTVSGGKVAFTKKAREHVVSEIETFADLFAARQELWDPLFGDIKTHKPHKVWVYGMSMVDAELQEWPNAEKFAERFLADVKKGLEQELAAAGKKP